jgi:predicted Zn-dependent protease
MYRTLSAILIVVIFGPLEAQQPSPPSQPAPVSVQVSEGPGAAFQFTKVDNNLRAEADAVDAQYEKRGLVLHDPDLQAYIDSTGSRILGNRPIPEKVTYRFLVLRDPMVNAFALPNGSVYITTGLLALLEDEAQLAGILGHETAHIYERHPYLENRSIRKKTVASEIIAAAAACVPGGYGAWLATAAAANVSTLILVESIYGYSREMESQADHDGLAAMTVAGYDPHAMAADFELLDQDRTLEYEPRPTFYHDHPNLIKRREEALAFADAHTPASARTVTRERLRHRRRAGHRVQHRHRHRKPSSAHRGGPRHSAGGRISGRSTVSGAARRLLSRRSGPKRLFRRPTSSLQKARIGSARKF